ncbi:nitrogen assimilation transcription factor nit-4 [Naviculisporaceae sp. PSN 640]
MDKMEGVSHDAGPGMNTAAATTAGSPDPTKHELAHHPFPPPPPPGPPSSSSGGRKHSATSMTNSPTQDQASVTSSHPPKRKRGPGDITQNACTECRKKRAKCDGQIPCGRCRSQKDVECVYEKRVNPSKDELRNQIEKLRIENELLKKEQRVSSHVIDALVHPDLGEQVLTRLRNGMSVHDVAQWVGETVSTSGAGAQPAHTGFPPGPGAGNHPLAGFTTASGSGPSLGYASGPSGLSASSPIATQSQHGMRYEPDQSSPGGGHFSPHSRTTRSNSQVEAMTWESESVRGPQPRVVSGPETTGDNQTRTHPITTLNSSVNHILTAGVGGTPVPANFWTKITSDSDLIKHLLSLYFCWEYPTFASLSKEHFIQDFGDGRTRFCSSILVNALLALGCRFSSRPTTRAVPLDPYTSGDHFFREALRLFNEETDHHKLTTIQALGIMSIREASCGRDSESWYYAGQSIRLAIEMGLHEIQGDGRDDDLTAVQAATFWGAFALDHAWSLATGSLPQCSCFPRLPPKPAIIHDIEASLWIPYTDDGLAPLDLPYEQPSNVRSVYKCFCELSELVHQSLYILHSPGKPLTANDLQAIYKRYLVWYKHIPEVLKFGKNYTPAVLFAHMYYHFAILLLFRPLIKLRIIGNDDLNPRELCLQAADAITGLLRSYAQMFTLKRTPSFVPYFVLTSCIMHLAIGAHHGGSEGGQINTRVGNAISRGIADLSEMAPCHFFAEQALNILRFLAKKWGIEVEIKSTDDEIQKRLNISDDRSVRPVTTSLNFFSPNITESDYNCEWGGMPNPQAMLGADSGAGLRPDSTPTEKVANALENPLFWPFPMQGRPILPTGDALREAGFELDPSFFSDNQVNLL